jgi:hypothetical protein
MIMPSICATLVASFTQSGGVRMGNSATVVTCIPSSSIRRKRGKREKLGILRATQQKNEEK